jgi:hypothetical protein
MQSEHGWLTAKPASVSTPTAIDASVVQAAASIGVLLSPSGVPVSVLVDESSGVPESPAVTSGSVPESPVAGLPDDELEEHPTAPRVAPPVATIKATTDKASFFIASPISPF